jgi:hypothetical protein
MAAIAKLGLSSNRLDYVCAWFVKAGEYIRGGEGRGWKPPRIGFVATNSITQGEQVAQLWPMLFERYALEIAFAHRTFAWMSDARGKAHVHCVIIGLTRRDGEPKEKRLFSYDDIKGDPRESRHAALTPYLFDASKLADRHLVVEREMNSLSSFPKLCVGTKPVDGGHYIFNDSERLSFLWEEPLAINIIHPFIGSEEFINGISRWILYSAVLAPGELRSMPRVMARIADVRRHRVAASGKLAQSLAQTPASFHVTVVPDAPFLVIPEVSSERRDYVPIGYLEPPTIPSNKLLVMRNADLWTFALLTSRMHMAWTRIVGGRLKSDFQYSVGINYNPFPWPQLDLAAKTKLEKACENRARRARGP